MNIDLALYNGKEFLKKGDKVKVKFKPYIEDSIISTLEIKIVDLDNKLEGEINQIFQSVRTNEIRIRLSGFEHWESIGVDDLLSIEKVEEE